MPIGLLALTIGSFGIGLTEFVILGLLPQVAEDFGVDIPTAGHLVSGYAISVAIGGVFITALASGRKPKHVLMLLMGLFIVGNFVSAIADSYTVMFIGRVIAALCHGAFFGVGAVLAATMVPPHRKAAAVSLMFAGLTTANVLGVPFGTFIGQSFGWRSTFWCITVIGVIALFGIGLLVKNVETSRTSKLRDEIRAFRNPQVWFSILITVFGFGAMFGTFTYIAPMLTDIAGFPEGAIPWMLVVFGLGLFVGNILGGRAADRALSKTLFILLASLTLILLVFSPALHLPWTAVIVLFLLGTVGFAAVPGMQIRVLNFAHEAPTLASGVNISAFNLGNAIGAYLGGLTIAAGFGVSSPSLVGAALAAIALLLLLTATLVQKKTKAADPELKVVTAP
ncbi:MFS transporter [Psychromicrobium sp. YIM B11713]|uniref:MFS transporter n=1 Tax=Psychromicrobium sp. YIM B11713 TaxID=3145233 RepID=UPI00374E6BFE